MVTRVETGRGRPTGWPTAVRRVSYAVLSGTAALTGIGIWVLMIVEDERTVGAATIEMAVKFTNVTTLLVAMVAAGIASGRSPTVVRAIAHLTAMSMSVVTAVVNVVLLDPALPGGWWGVVDLFQHYLIPAAVVTSWAAVGPCVDIGFRRLGWVLVIPFGWLAFVLVRGAAIDDYPYDFVDVAESGRPRVLATVSVLVVFVLGLCAAAVAIDRRRYTRPTRADTVVGATEPER